MTGNAGGKGIFRIGYASAFKEIVRICPSSIYIAYHPYL